MLEGQEVVGGKVVVIDERPHGLFGGHGGQGGNIRRGAAKASSDE